MVKMKIFGVITVLFVMCKYIACDDTQESPSTCIDLKPQNNVDIDQLLGTWYANEIIMHSGDKHSELTLNSCVQIDLSDITNTVYRMYDASQRPNYRYLKLLWSEENNGYEHILLYNKTIRGIWIAKTTPLTANNNVSKQSFGQFNGVIQVMKAVGNHMVLNFCEKNERLFSLALARSPNMYTAEDLGSAHTLLIRRGLSTKSAARLCNGSAMHNISIMSLFIALVAIVFKQF